MNGWRFAIFITLVLTVWGLMHSYVFWRQGTIPWVAAHCSNRGMVLTALALWLSYVSLSSAERDHSRPFVPKPLSTASVSGHTPYANAPSPNR